MANDAFWIDGKKRFARGRDYIPRMKIAVEIKRPVRPRRKPLIYLESLYRTLLRKVGFAKAPEVCEPAIERVHITLIYRRRTKDRPQQSYRRFHTLQRIVFEPLEQCFAGDC